MGIGSYRKARHWLAGAVLFWGFLPPLQATPLPLAGKVIVLDPGHAVKNAGGDIINPGARARRGAYERDVALAVAARAQTLLEARGAKVYLTRTPRNPWRFNDVRQGDNRSRAIFANVLRADAYVRLHCDWNRDRRFKGHTTYYFQWGSRPLAEHMNHALGAALAGHEDHGIHRRSFVSVTAKMPTVLLELGVLSYKPEAKLLGDPVYQGVLSQAVADGLTDYFK